MSPLPHALAQVMALFLTLVLAAGSVRIWLGPSPYDRMVAAQFAGTGVVAILLLLAFGLEAPALLDVALIVALFAALAGIALVRRPPTPPRENPR